MKGFAFAAFAALILSINVQPAQAGGIFSDFNSGLTWVRAPALKGQHPARACARKYRGPIYGVKRRRTSGFYCLVYVADMYGRGERRQNFNQ